MGIDAVDVVALLGELSVLVLDAEVLVEAEVDQPVIACPAVGVEHGLELGAAANDRLQKSLSSHTPRSLCRHALREICKVSAGDGDGGDGGGFGTQDAWAQGDVGPVMVGKEGHFFGGPAAFGTDGQGVG